MNKVVLGFEHHSDQTMIKIGLLKILSTAIFLDSKTFAHRALKCIKKSLDGVIGTACEATLQYHYQNILLPLTQALFAESFINTFHSFSTPAKCLEASFEVIYRCLKKFFNSKSQF